MAKHPELDVPNLHVIKLMQSFKSKEYVTERFAWRHYYWYGVGIGACQILLSWEILGLISDFAHVMHRPHFLHSMLCLSTGS